MNRGINAGINNPDALRAIRKADEKVVVCGSAECGSGAGLRFAGTITLEFSEMDHTLLIKTDYFYKTASDAKIAMGNFCKKIRAASEEEFQVIVDDFWNDGVLSPKIEATKGDDKVIIVPELHENITDIWSCLVTMYHDGYKVASFSISPEGSAASRKETAVAYVRRIIESIQKAEIVVKDDD